MVSNETPTSRTDVITYVNGSSGATPNKRDSIKRASATAPPRPAQRYANDDRAQPLSQEQTRHGRLLRPKHHPDADLAHALSDHRSDDRVDADHAQQQRHRS